MKTFIATNRGKVRAANEDSVYEGRVEPFGEVLIIADGLGGYNGGKYASSIAIDAVVGHIRGGEYSLEELEKALHLANEKILDIASKNSELKEMGTTCTVASVREERAMIAHVGDSRAYIFHEGTLTQITKDHSFIQSLVDRGLLTKEEARVNKYRNSITRCLGMKGLTVDLFDVSIFSGDILLLCSDGLFQYFSDRELEKIIRHDRNLERTVQKLMRIALRRGGSDNISVGLLKMEGSEDE